MDTGILVRSRSHFQISLPSSLNRQRSSAPVLWANLSISNSSIPEHWPRPYDPFTVPPAAYGADCDWRQRRPELAYVVAGPEAYEVSDSGHGQVMLLGGGGRDVKFYRLTEEWAAKLGLERSWHPGSSFRMANAREGEGEKLEALGLREVYEDQVVTFAQPWMWTAPEV